MIFFVAFLILVGWSSSLSAEDPWDSISPFFVVPDKYKSDGGKYQSPLMFKDGSRVTRPSEWKRRRSEIKSEWESLLGKWPELLTKQQLKIEPPIRRQNFSQSKISFRWTPEEITSGYLTVPDGPGPFPAVITVFYEPETAIGKGKPERDFAYQLAQRGFVTLSIGTSQATRDRTYALYWPSIQDAKVQPLSMLAYAASNACLALGNHPKVDRKRIGIVGHSFGGKWAMFASCLYEGFACAAWSDPGIVFDTRPSVNYWEPWYLGYHPKPWRRRGLITKENPARGLYPKLLKEGRDLHELHALMAPRPFLVSGGSEDPPGRWQALKHSVDVNRVLGFKNRVGMTNRPDHSPNAESNEVIYKFFEHVLKSKKSAN